MRNKMRIAVLSAIAGFLTSGTAVCQLGLEFTYQGRLDENGQPANGTYDIEISMWDDNVGGSQLGATLILPNEPISDGLLTVELAWAAELFDDSDRHHFEAGNLL